MDDRVATNFLYDCSIILHFYPVQDHINASILPLVPFLTLEHYELTE